MFEYMDARPVMDARFSTLAKEPFGVWRDVLKFVMEQAEEDAQDQLKGNNFDPDCGPPVFELVPYVSTDDAAENARRACQAEELWLVTAKDMLDAFQCVELQVMHVIPAEDEPTLDAAVAIITARETTRLLSMFANPLNQVHQLMELSRCVEAAAKRCVSIPGAGNPVGTMAALREAIDNYSTFHATLVWLPMYSPQATPDSN